MTVTLLGEFEKDMRIAKMSPVTIENRLELILRLVRFLDPTDLRDATGDHLREFQSTFAHLAPNSVNVYSRHMRAFFSWAVRRRLLTVDPAEGLVIPRAPRGKPHPTRPEDLATIFACTKGVLRIVYILATFAGLRRGEICRLDRRDLELAGSLATALVNGKGGRQRTVPLLRPVVDELNAYGLPRSGPVVTLHGKRYPVEKLSVDSHYHLQGLGLETTLHSMRHTFATEAARFTRDPLFVRDLVGHQSVATTEIYMDSSMQDAHLRLAQMSTNAAELLRNGRPGAGDSPPAIYAVPL